MSLYIGFVSQVSSRLLIERIKALTDTNLCIILHLTAYPATRSKTEAALSSGRQLQPSLNLRVESSSAMQNNSTYNVPIDMSFRQGV